MRTISFTNPSSSSPSFLIQGASGSGSPARSSAPSLRLDRIDSRLLLASARRILFAYLEQGTYTEEEPLGIVLSADLRQGRVVFELPVLLPDEQFVPLELIKGGELLARSRRNVNSRLRMPRSGQRKASDP